MASQDVIKKYGITCPAQSTFYVCDKVAPHFVGCCSVDPCSTSDGLCPDSDLYSTSFDQFSYTQIEDQACVSSDSKTRWWTCAAVKTPFMGCCSIDPCSDRGCPAGNLTAARLSDDTDKAATFLPKTGPTLSTAAIVGIAVGSTVMVMLVVGISIWCCLRKRRQKKEEAKRSRSRRKPRPSHITTSSTGTRSRSTSKRPPDSGLYDPHGVYKSAYEDLKKKQKSVQSPRSAHFPTKHGAVSSPTSAHFSTQTVSVASRNPSRVVSRMPSQILSNERSSQWYPTETTDPPSYPFSPNSITGEHVFPEVVTQEHSQPHLPPLPPIPTEEQEREIELKRESAFQVVAELQGDLEMHQLDPHMLGHGEEFIHIIAEVEGSQISRQASTAASETPLRSEMDATSTEVKKTKRKSKTKSVERS